MEMKLSVVESITQSVHMITETIISSICNLSVV